MILFKGNSGRSWRYDPYQPLGKRGGFGEVYAGQGEDGTPSAVKLISPTFTGLHPRLLQREIEIAKKLQDNPCQYLIRTLDIGEIDGQLVLVMELAEGSLDEVLAIRMVEGEAVAALQDIAAGLRELHQLGIIHRDLKPSNVLRHGGKWKLADFGIAHDTEVGMQTYTFAGWVGTWAYVAPELFDPRSPTVKSDLYALGCVAFEILTGRPPFAGPDWEDFRRQHAEWVPPNLPTATNPALHRLVIQLLHKKPEERPQDAREVVERLGRIATPLSLPQQNLLRVSAKFVSEQSAQAAKQAAGRAEAEHRKKDRHQAVAGLKAICEEGLDAIQTALPDITFTEGGMHKKVFILEGRDARLEIEEWLSWLGTEKSLEPEDPLIDAGVITARNRRSKFWARRAESPGPDYPAKLANIVAEVEEGRIVWMVYRFRCLDASRNYELGPKDREHGLKYRDFFDQRKQMHSGRIFGRFSLSSGASLTKLPLTPQSLIDLYTEALALPHDAYSEYE